MERLLTMLSAEASNQPLGAEHGVRYRLLAQVHHCPPLRPTEKYRPLPEDDNVEVEDFEPTDRASEPQTDPRPLVEQHDLTEGGKLYFPKY